MLNPRLTTSAASSGDGRRIFGRGLGLLVVMRTDGEAAVGPGVINCEMEGDLLLVEKFEMGSSRGPGCARTAVVDVEMEEKM